MAQRILGLDLGAHAVKAVLVESTFRGYAVTRTARVPLADAEAEPSPARFAPAVKALLADAGLAFDAAVVALPGAGASSLSVTLPFSDPRRIEQTIGFEVEGQIPFDLADVAWDWQPLSVRDGKTDLLVSVVRKDEATALLAALAEAGVDPRAVVPAGPAYASLFAAGAIARSAPPAAPPAPSAPAAEGTEGAAARPARSQAAAPGAEVLVDVGQDRTSV